jgi:hypothetical protein
LLSNTKYEYCGSTKTKLIWFEMFSSWCSKRTVALIEFYLHCPEPLDQDELLRVTLEHLRCHRRILGPFVPAWKSTPFISIILIPLYLPLCGH